MLLHTYREAICGHDPHGTLKLSGMQKRLTATPSCRSVRFWELETPQQRNAEDCGAYALAHQDLLWRLLADWTPKQELKPEFFESEGKLICKIGTLLT